MTHPKSSGCRLQAAGTATEKKEQAPEPEKAPAKERKPLPAEKKSVLIFTVTGMVAGYLSYLIANSMLSLAIMLVMLYGSMKAARFAVKEKKDPKWLMSNGGTIYIFLWFIIWIMFYTLGA
jgi:hypothetical protein